MDKAKVSQDKNDDPKVKAEKAAAKRAEEDQKLAEKRAEEDLELDPIKREAENKRIDQERLMAGNPTTVTTPDGDAKVVTDGATFDGYGNEIRR